MTLLTPPNRYTYLHPCRSTIGEQHMALILTVAWALIVQFILTTSTPNYSNSRCFKHTPDLKSRGHIQRFAVKKSLKMDKLVTFTYDTRLRIEIDRE